MGAAKNVGITVVSVLLVVAIVIGAVANVKSKGSSASSNGSTHTVDDEASTPSTSSKTVEAICAPTQHKEACISSLQSVKPDATIKDYLEAAVKATMLEVKKAMNATNNVVIDKNDDPHNDKARIESCKNFLNQTVGQLEEAILKVVRSDVNTIQKSANDFIANLTGANIYLQTCVDDMGKAEYKSAVEKNLETATQLTQNALYIFAKIKEVLGALNISDSLSNFFVEVAGNGVDNSSGFPQWVSPRDRKLLQAPVPPQPTGAAPVPPQPTGAAPVAPQPDAAAAQPNGTTPVAQPQPAAGVAPQPNGATPAPNVVVAQDGSGQFKTIMEAVNTVPVTNVQRFIIYVKAGTYNEIVQIKDKHNLLLMGDGIGKTILTGNLSNRKGGTTSTTATLAVESNLFMARGLTIENTAGADEHQAVALRINGEKTVVFECEIRGYQDTLYYHRGLQFYKNCIISGTIDFIFGYGRALIQDSLIIVKKPGLNQANMVTADGGLTPVGQHGLVIQNCKIVPDPQLVDVKATTQTFLGRPWKEYTVTIFMQNDIDDFIVPAGYSVFTLPPDPGCTNQNNAIYGEYMNRGPGAINDHRDKTTFPHFKVLSHDEADGYTVGKFIDGSTWLPATGVSVNVGL